MGAGGIIQQRAEMRTAIGPGTANFARLKFKDQQDGTTYAAQTKAICDKNVNDWTEQETSFVSMAFVIAVHC